MNTNTAEIVTALLSAPYEVAEEEVAFFQKNGFLKLNKITSADEVASIRQQLRQLFDHQAGRDEGLFFDFAGSDEQPAQMRLPQLLDVRNFAPDLMKSSFFRNASEVAKQLLGPDASFKADHALLKPPGDGAETPWHQDDAFRDLDYLHNEVSIWLALQDTDKENGCLGFVPATNDKDVLPHRWVGGDSRIHALECYEGWSKEDVVWCPLLAGDCSVHTNRIVHGAGANISTRPRMAYVLVFGTPSTRAPVPRKHPWLVKKAELRLDRRKRWLRRGGFAVHAWRRLKQIPEVGASETVARAWRKVRLLMTSRRPV